MRWEGFNVSLFFVLNFKSLLPIKNGCSLPLLQNWCFLIFDMSNIVLIFEYLAYMWVILFKYLADIWVIFAVSHINLLAGCRQVGWIYIWMIFAAVSPNPINSLLAFIRNFTQAGLHQHLAWSWTWASVTSISISNIKIIIIIEKWESLKIHIVIIWMQAKAAFQWLRSPHTSSVSSTELSIRIITKTTVIAIIFKIKICIILSYDHVWSICSSSMIV